MKDLMKFKSLVQSLFISGKFLTQFGEVQYTAFKTFDIKITIQEVKTKYVYVAQRAILLRLQCVSMKNKTTNFSSQTSQYDISL